MMFLAVLWQLIVVAVIVAAVKPTPTFDAKRNNNGPPSQFVTTQDGQFMVNGSAFRFIGTNAYWLPVLNKEEDIDNTLASMAAANITVVRTWAFNDVETIPENGTWFQLINNGTLTINNGTNGLPKLDKVVELAQKHGIYVLLSLTNNWNPLALLDNSTNSSIPFGASRRDITPGTNNTLPRNSLSNDYGGMDLYVRQLGDIHQHDQFFVNETIITAFMNYTTQIVSRYVNSPSVFAWELANDARCNSSLPASPECQPTNVTLWHSRIANHIRSIDTNHLVSSGNQGFFCIGCPKMFPLVVAPPPPQPSPAPGRRRRSPPERLTKAKVLKERKAAWKRARDVQNRTSPASGGVRIRGRWVSSHTRRQEELGMDSSLDGSHGVDSEDIINIPDIAFGSFQLFPDQNTYAPDDPNLPRYNNNVQNGMAWIIRQAETARIFGKPVALTGFGLVTQNNSQAFVPFNSSIAPFAPDQGSQSEPTQQPFGVTDQQRDEAYSSWLATGISSGLQGMIHYQWGQGNLTAQDGTAVSPPPSEAGTTPNGEISGVSPNDGYSIEGIGKDDVVATLEGADQGFAPDV